MHACTPRNDDPCAGAIRRLSIRRHCPGTPLAVGHLVRIALTIYDGRIAPVFESAQRLLVIDVPAARGSRHEVSLAGLTGIDRVRHVGETGADELVCGGITGSVRHLLEARGIRVRPWVALDVETALRMVTERSRTPMKIIVSATEAGPDARVEPRFGRAP